MLTLTLALVTLTTIAVVLAKIASRLDDHAADAKVAADEAAAKKLAERRERIRMLKEVTK